MTRPLLIVAGAGIGISIACFLLAGMLSPYGTSYPFRYRPPYNDSNRWSSRLPWSGYVPFSDSGEIVTREFSWDGTDRAEIYIPCIVYYTPAPEWHVTVKGRESSVAHLRMHDGGILFDAPSVFSDTALEVRITGPSIRIFGVNSSGKLILENIAQKDLQINIRGSGSVQGSGTVGTLQVRIFGSGNAELAELATKDVETKIFGSGNADVAASGEVEVSIFGSGDVRLHAHPKNVSSKTFGSGRVIQLEPGQNASQDASLNDPI